MRCTCFPANGDPWTTVLNIPRCQLRKRRVKINFRVCENWGGKGWHLGRLAIQYSPFAKRPPLDRYWTTLPFKRSLRFREVWYIRRSRSYRLLRLEGQALSAPFTHCVDTQQSTMKWEKKTRRRKWNEDDQHLSYRVDKIDKIIFINGWYKYYKWSSVFL